MTFGRVLLFASLVLLVVGCGRRENAVDAGIRTQTLHWNISGEPRDFDPHTTTLTTDGIVIRAVMEGLVDLDPAKSTPVPGVAERWETSADGLTWTFHLRATARWSNGDPVTAQDFVFSYQRVLSPALGAEYREQFYCLQNAREFAAGQLTDVTRVGVRAPDECRVQHPGHGEVVEIAAPAGHEARVLESLDRGAEPAGRREDAGGRRRAAHGQVTSGKTFPASSSSCPTLPSSELSTSAAPATPGYCTGRPRPSRRRAITAAAMRSRPADERARSARAVPRPGRIRLD